MAITRESAREMSDEALSYTLNDLDGVIESCEADFVALRYTLAPHLTPAGYEGWLTAKHSQYLDERFAVIEALVARRRMSWAREWIASRKTDEEFADFCNTSLSVTWTK